MTQFSHSLHASLLGDALDSLTKIPLNYKAEDRMKLCGDDYDNAPSFYGPDDDGTYYKINHSRVVRR